MIGDVALLVLHFTVLSILSVYGLHRYHLAWLSLRHRNSAPTIQSDQSVSKWPKVTIQLPVFNERYVVERLIDAVCEIEYPTDLLEIQLLDDSTDDTQIIALKCCEKWRDLGKDIHYIHRTERIGFKAGALEAGTANAFGEIIVVFDADFLPATDFLKRVIPHFENPNVGMVQTRWAHINRMQNQTTKAQAILLDGHFLVEHFARSRAGKFFNFNGTAGAWRKTAIIDSGGWHHETLTEDLDLSYRAQLNGWTFIYLDDVVTPAELPSGLSAFKTQQHRWAKGSIQVCIKLLPTILRSSIPWRVKLEAFIHLTNNFAYVLMLFMSLLMPMALHIRVSQGWHYALYLDLPVFLGATISIICFYVIGQIRSGERWLKRCLDLPITLAIGIGLSVNNTVAVLEACIGHKTPFVRTPKYAYSAGAKTLVKKGSDRNKLSLIPFIEIGFAFIYSYSAMYCILNQVWTALPFMFLFAWGYGYVGVCSLLESIGLKKNSKQTIHSQRIA